jgi:hypothetical protein
MATKLSISDLADVLAAIKEVTKLYQLGIQLKLGPSDLDEIEKNHPRDIGRQKTEVVKYWLRNSPYTSWTTLSKAVEGMGGHAKLAETLREKEQGIMEDTTKIQGEEEQLHENPMFLPPQLMFSHEINNVQPSVKVRSPSRSQCLMLSCQMSYYKPSVGQSSTVHSLDRCVRRNILLLGKMGHGTSTLGNRILGYDGWFKINDQRCPQTAQGSSLLNSASQLKDYKIEVTDHSGLFEGASSIDKLSFAVPRRLNVAIFVLKGGCEFDESEVEILKSVVSEWQISGITSLVLTHCERLSDKERGEMIEQFKKDHRSIANLMGKGILAVGFPDSSHVQPESPLSQRVEEDKANLRQLIYSCEEPVFLPQSENCRCLCCSIL